MGLLQHLPDEMVMVFCCGAAVTAGLAFHQWIEVPLGAALRFKQRVLVAG